MQIPSKSCLKKINYFFGKGLQRTSNKSTKLVTERGKGIWQVFPEPESIPLLSHSFLKFIVATGVTLLLDFYILQKEIFSLPKAFIT